MTTAWEPPSAAAVAAAEAEATRRQAEAAKPAVKAPAKPSWVPPQVAAYEAELKAAVEAEAARVAKAVQHVEATIRGDQPLDDLDPSIIGKPYTGRR